MKTDKRPVSHTVETTSSMTHEQKVQAVVMGQYYDEYDAYEANALDRVNAFDAAGMVRDGFDYAAMKPAIVEHIIQQVDRDNAWVV